MLSTLKLLFQDNAKIISENRLSKFDLEDAAIALQADRKAARDIAYASSWPYIMFGFGVTMGGFGRIIPVGSTEMSTMGVIASLASVAGLVTNVVGMSKLIMSGANEVLINRTLAHARKDELHNDRSVVRRALRAQHDINAARFKPA